MMPLENPAALNQPPVTPSLSENREHLGYCPSFSSDLLSPPSRPSSSQYLSLLRARYTFRSAYPSRYYSPLPMCSGVLVPLELRPRLPLTLPGSLNPFPALSMNGFHRQWSGPPRLSLSPSFSPFSLYLPSTSFDLSVFLLSLSMLRGGWPTGCSPDYLLDYKSSDLLASSSSPRASLLRFAPLSWEDPSLLYPHLNFSSSLCLSLSIWLSPAPWLSCL